MAEARGGIHLISYQEALRSLGALLDAAVAARIRVVVDVAGITLDAPGGFGHQRFTWAQLDELAAARRSLRGQQRTTTDSLRFSRWQPLLRLAGRALDAIGLPRFELHATLAPSDDPFACYLEVTVDGQHRLGETELAHHLTEVQAIRAERTAQRPKTPADA